MKRSSIAPNIVPVVKTPAAKLKDGSVIVSGIDGNFLFINERFRKDDLNPLIYKQIVKKINR